MKIYGPEDFGFTVNEMCDDAKNALGAKSNVSGVDFTVLDENFSVDVAADLEDILWDEDYLIFGEDFCATLDNNSNLTKKDIIKKLTDMGFTNHEND